MSRKDRADELRIFAAWLDMQKPSPVQNAISPVYNAGVAGGIEFAALQARRRADELEQ